ncbi:MAG: ATP synthase F0 subunit B [Desulfobacterium sp.]|nr:ATP synthase F0 subunit B [Desulfobacterium sp.]MBU3949140.1 ATP synthase F0 subunit B [Pseudomonadota bacterium]MBU4011012.1 ATP synthase F0 subunit B [Pseudomonadota bacterium]
MKIPFVKHKSCIFIVFFLFFLLFFSAGIGLCSSGGEGGGHKVVWLPTDTYRVMNFAALAIGLFLLLRKPAANALSDRIKGIKEQLSELEAQKSDAEKNMLQCNDRVVKLDKESEKIIAEYLKQGEEAKVRILEAANSSVVKLEEQASRNIEHEFKQARLKLQEEVIINALEKAEEKIKSKITAKDQELLVNEYLEKVVA